MYEEQIAAVIAQIKERFGDQYWDEKDQCISGDTEDQIEEIVDVMIQDGTFWAFIESIPETPDGYSIFDQKTPFEVNKKIAFWTIIDGLRSLKTGSKY